MRCPAAARLAKLHRSHHCNNGAVCACDPPCKQTRTQTWHGVPTVCGDDGWSLSPVELPWLAALPLWCRFKARPITPFMSKVRKETMAANKPQDDKRWLIGTRGRPQRVVATTWLLQQMRNMKRGVNVGPCTHGNKHSSKNNVRSCHPQVNKAQYKNHSTS